MLPGLLAPQMGPDHHGPRDRLQEFDQDLHDLKLLFSGVKTEHLVPHSWFIPRGTLYPDGMLVAVGWCIELVLEGRQGARSSGPKNVVRSFTHSLDEVTLPHRRQHLANEQQRNGAAVARLESIPLLSSLPGPDREYIYIYYIHPELRIGNCPSWMGKGAGPL